MPQTINEEPVIIEQYNKIAQLIVETALREHKGYDYLRELCEIGPRLSGSDQSLYSYQLGL